MLKAWLLWTAAAAALAVTEVLTIGLFLAAFAVGAVLACVLVAAGVSFSVSLAALAVVAVVFVLTSGRGFWLGGGSRPASQPEQPRSAVPARPSEPIGTAHLGAVKLSDEGSAVRA